MISQSQIEEAKALIDGAERIVLTAHVGPDGDAIGSVMGMYHWLRAQGKQVTPMVPDEYPRYFTWMEDVEQVLRYDQKPEEVKQAVREADLIIMLDFNDMKRNGKIGELIQQSAAKKMLLDHHMYPSVPADLVISDPKAPATCYLVYQLIDQMGRKSQLSKAGAECIYTGLMTDTGNFSYNNSCDPELFLIVAELLRLGIDKTQIQDNVNNFYSQDRVRFMGYCLSRMEIFPEQHAALIAIGKKDLYRFNYKSGDSEGIVNMPMTIDGVFFSCLMREDKDKIKISFRSQGKFPCNEMAQEYFLGGGHFNASGGEWHGTLEEAVERFKNVLPAYFEKHKSEGPTRKLAVKL